ncbi:uncharacterized protein LOC108225163 [Daucus carota subsp. sativus]|uniref:Uncharacterized protein n=1 Tax=Daucus carota subsp. sativus TaxID=79200 RepID=A0A161ZRG3_DAUCS|nr:PREDICTED: uncharacterized protein LOC108225163 [Daucus carota subsp. sativus]
MSLVDYASSSDEENEEKQRVNPPPTQNKPTRPPPTQRTGPSVSQQAETSSGQGGSSLPKLPSASLVLNSPLTLPGRMNSDHSSKVEAARAENAARKRESNLSSTDRLSKVPKGNLIHSRNRPDTASGLLRPPQLGGRSNVVTEDISKLFVKKPSDPKSN